MGRGGNHELKVPGCDKNTNCPKKTLRERETNLNMKLILPDVPSAV